jgi:hypothetical protein
MDADGSNKKILYKRGYADYPAWSPDGTKIYAKTPAFRIIDINTGEVLQKNERIRSAKIHWGKNGYLQNGNGYIAVMQNDFNSNLVLGAAVYVDLPQYKDVSQFKYKWGGFETHEKDQYFEEN